MRQQIYDITQSPEDGKWYVIGYCGRANNGRQQWVVVSTAFAVKSTARDWIRHQYQADRAATLELGGI